jgi:hypothetical protein
MQLSGQDRGRAKGVSSFREAETSDVEDGGHGRDEPGEMDQVGRIGGEDGVAATARTHDDSGVDDVAGPRPAAQFAGEFRKGFVERLDQARRQDHRYPGIRGPAPGLGEDRRRHRYPAALTTERWPEGSELEGSTVCRDEDSGVKSDPGHCSSTALA